MILDFTTGHHEGIHVEPNDILVYAKYHVGGPWLLIRNPWYADTKSGKVVESTGPNTGSIWHQVKFCLPVPIAEPRDDDGDESDDEPRPPDDPSREDVERVLNSLVPAVTAYSLGASR